MSLAVGAGFWQAADPRRKAVGRFMVIGAWTGLAAHAVVAATVRLS